MIFYHLQASSQAHTQIPHLRSTWSAASPSAPTNSGPASHVQHPFSASQRHFDTVRTDDSGPTDRTGRGRRIGVQHQSHRPYSNHRNHPRARTTHHHRIYQPHHRRIFPPSPGAHEQRDLMVNTPCFLQSNQAKATQETGYELSA